MKCKKCGSEMQIQMVAEKQRRGCLSILMWITLCVFTFGLVILIPILRGNKSKTKKYYVCNNCGYTIKS